MTTDAAQQSLAEKVKTFLEGLSRDEAALFAVSIAGGIRAGEGMEGDTVEVQGFGFLPLAGSAISPVVAPKAPQVQAQCSWQVTGPGTLCYICGTVRVQCINFG